MSERLSVVVAGARGRMGAYACELLAADSRFALVGRAHRGDDLAALLRAEEPALLLDLTVAGVGYEHARIALESNVRPVVGTSGVRADEVLRLDALALERHLGGLVVPNFSLGAWLVQRAAELCAAHMGHAEIIEMHHERKKDAPSATALETASRIERARGSQRSDSIPIHSVRLPGLAAHQLVVFGGTGETVTLRHDTQGLHAYAVGIVAALRYAAQARGVARGIESAFDWQERRPSLSGDA
ncbi:MAG: 4-hydroxy-tetrahydrodipicolinate reductase [Planctomycetota bacterium]